MLAPACGKPFTSAGSDQAGEPQTITELPEGAVFYLGDQQESPLVVTDARGDVVRTAVYHPYGSVRKARGSEVDPFAFVGNERDHDVGLGDFQARPYWAEAGIFYRVVGLVGSGWDLQRISGEGPTELRLLNSQMRAHAIIRGD